jgi:argininosuccinate lyase
MQHALADGFLTATEVADYLVRKGLSFREAHGIVGQIVQYCEQQGTGFETLSQVEWNSFSHSFDADISEIISAAGAVEAKKSHGGTASEAVQEQLKAALAALETGL